MNERKILVANTKTQKRYEVFTDATTLGELKSALDMNNIDYSGMTFTEGISKTQLVDDASQLPKDVMYKGQPTNELVILLTNTKKNIASGAMSRKEVYDLIKDNELGADIKEYFGKNYTVVPTADLEEYIRDNYDIFEDDDEEWEPEPIDYCQVKANEFYDDIKQAADEGELASMHVMSIGERCVELAHRLEVAEKAAAESEVKDKGANDKIDDILAGF